MADTTIKLSGTYDSIEAYELLEEMRSVASDYLPLTGGEISGDLIVDGQISGNVTGTASGNLPLSGGTMTGEIKRSGDAIDSTNDTSWIRFCGGTNVDNGGVLTLWGKSHSTNPGEWRLKADDAINEVSLFGKPDGTLTWNGYNVLTDATVGTVVTKDVSTSVSVSANTATNITSISLAKGTWVVNGNARISSVTSAKIYGLGISTTSQSYAYADEGTVALHASSTGTIDPNVTRILTLASTTTVYLCCYATAATTVSNAHLTAVRIV